jgi:hypothetical protein
MDMLLADKGFDNDRLRALLQTTEGCAESQPKGLDPV